MTAHAEKNQVVYRRSKISHTKFNAQFFWITAVIAHRTVERKIAAMNEYMLPHAALAGQFFVTIFALVTDGCMIGLSIDVG
jgi:hypothetical protein